MKKKLLLTIAIVAVLAGGYFQSKAQTPGWATCRGYYPEICTYIVIDNVWYPYFGQWMPPDL
jgi:hypothetical protein